LNSEAEPVCIAFFNPLFNKGFHDLCHELRIAQIGVMRRLMLPDGGMKEIA
jgi:hypothetical protein